MMGRDIFVAKVDLHVIIFYPLAYFLTITSVTMLFRQVRYRYFTDYPTGVAKGYMQRLRNRSTR